MKTLFVSLALTALTVLAGCGGAEFQAGEFSPAEAGAGGAASAGHAGRAGAEAGGSSAGALPAAGAGSFDAAGAGGEAPSGGSAGAALSAAGSGGSAGMSSPCEHPVPVLPGVDVPIGTQPICLQNKASFSALTFRGWDNRSLKVNGKAFACWADTSATCSIQTTFPPAIGGYNYLELGAGQSTMIAIEWVM